ncbi:MAG: flagellar biosynthesis protein FlhB [Alphaproteobacteria bacterium]|nr:MAG: flagellar biosynthesis protein FlhB [Alphaproteobacteria bacterium]
MSGENERGGDKPHEASEKKLADARKRGELPRSADLNTAAAYAGLLIAGLAFGGASLNALGTALAAMLSRADGLSDLLFAEPARPVAGAMILAVAGPVAAWFAVPAALVLASLLLQRAIVVAPQKLQPRLSRISPFANAAQKFGRAGLFEFAKSTLKLVIFGALVALFLASRLEDMLTMLNRSPRQITVGLLELALRFLAIVAVISAAIGVVDALFQRATHLHRMRMTRKELEEEAKQTEGDPHLRQARRQRAYEIATNSMLAEVPSADVVIVNPEHYAVALRWSRAPGSAPVCVAKGVDAVAARIREAAQEAGVPIHRDPPTARALHAAVEIGEEIRPEHYRAVAAAIRFADEMRRAARRRWR